MKFTINTNKFQDLVAKAIKGSSNDKLLPITSLMAIDHVCKKLTLTTTDATNYFQVSTQTESTESFSVVVLADSFAKLISKMTCENITLDIEADSLTVLGGKSKYKIELPLDVDGTFVKLTVPEVPQGIAPEKVHVGLIKTMIDTAKSALCTDQSVVALTSYYAGDCIFSTDGEKICSINRKFAEVPVLLSATTVDLLELMPNGQEGLIDYVRDDDMLVFTTADCRLITRADGNTDEYDVDLISGLVNTEFVNECVVKKNELLQALDRLSVFVGAYDRNVIKLTFGDNVLVMENKKSVGFETLDCLKGGETAFECMIDVEMFKNQVKVNSVDEVTIQYGLDNTLKLVDGDTVQVLGLFNE